MIEEQVKEIIEKPQHMTCPLCHKLIDGYYASFNKSCPTPVEGSKFSHYAVNRIGEFLIQITIIPPYMICTIIGDVKSKIYKFPITTIDKSFIMQMPTITYEVLEDQEKLAQRIKKLVIFT